MSSFCKSCGAESTGSNFCPSCGVALNSQSSESALSPMETSELDAFEDGESVDQKRKKKKSILIVASALVLVVALAGSFIAFRPSPSAFTINGESYSKEELNALVDALVEVGDITKQNGTIPKAIMNQLIGTILFDQAVIQLAKKNNLKEDPADRALVAGQIESSEDLATAPKALKIFHLDRNVALLTLSKLKKPSVRNIEKLYNNAPASTGVLCLSHILVNTKAQAAKALKQINEGAKFADVAKKVSIDPGSKTSGGSLANGDEPCISLTSMQEDFDGDFMVGAVAAKPGVPTQPVKTEFGWHIILSLPYRDVKDSVSSVFNENPAASLLAGFMATSDIRLNSAYGTWVPATAKIS
jgi:parvulin-like peptidyl-prolyl isomerase